MRTGYQKEYSLSDMFDVSIRFVHRVVQEDIDVMLEDFAVLSQWSGLEDRMEELPRLTKADRIMLEDNALVKP